MRERKGSKCVKGRDPNALVLKAVCHPCEHSHRNPIWDIHPIIVCLSWGCCHLTHVTHLCWGFLTKFTTALLSYQIGAVECHFAYRMIVVLMRRELSLEQSLRLWEMLWAHDFLSDTPPPRGSEDAPEGQTFRRGVGSGEEGCISTTPDAQARVGDQGPANASSAAAGSASGADVADPVFSPPTTISFEWSSHCLLYTSPSPRD